MEDRINSAQNYVVKVFINNDFFSKAKLVEVLEDIPLSAKITSSFGTERPLLTSQQERHLFRKMNYFKYKAKRLLEKSVISNARLEKAESFIGKATEIRNVIAESNFRIISKLKGQLSCHDKDSFVSDAYFDLLKAVDYFDWTKDLKFSTYVVTVIKNNFFRSSKDNKRKSERFVDINEAVNKESGCDGISEEIEYEKQKALIQSLLVLLKHSSDNSNQFRYVFILEKYFGLNGNKKHTLDQISQMLDITKERVRQLKEKAIRLLQSKIQEMKINYDIVIENV